jgi:hypothetical protein
VYYDVLGIMIVSIKIDYQIELYILHNKKHKKYLIKELLYKILKSIVGRMR